MNAIAPSATAGSPLGAGGIAGGRGSSERETSARDLRGEVEQVAHHRRGGRGRGRGRGGRTVRRRAGVGDDARRRSGDARDDERGAAEVPSRDDAEERSDRWTTRGARGTRRSRARATDAMARRARPSVPAARGGRARERAARAGRSGLPRETTRATGSSLGGRDRRAGHAPRARASGPPFPPPRRSNVDGDRCAVG